ncbi:ATP phosphoribosyltransferase HisG [Legionella maceachernii]|uniref:ATP phosphoribosyltransferase n=1 Tax=Legionella maceachernii TaxID=466 RepID=A0A0W0VYZ1_9GAMM|nr:ATP phosphoribosyltransferase [Legionella maceachernii]KTD25233.1 ATP phosphoribosyltransferase HisG [Legionella maceachernii]SJZ76958.1 ATP phosphoribosyltransferase [Legionella maceachernii]SUP03069.1 ATP phosphoribosyltransferase [Legionella maceachernii]
MNRIRLALQKKGRLAQESLTLLQRCGLKFRLKENALLTHVDNLPIDLLFVRDDDIPTLIFDGLCDGGIVGENVLLEAALGSPNKSYKTILNLGNCRCRLAIAVPEEFDYRGPGSLDGKRIATSYPLLLAKYLAEQQICAERLILSGSVEVAPRMGMADAICDLVSTGQTLEENKLIEVETVLVSQAVFIQADKAIVPAIQDVFDMLKRRIQAVQQAAERKYILFHAPKTALARICERLPGAESPTILPLPDYPDKVAVHVVSSEGIFWNTLETIQSLGASSILVLPIEKMLE